MDNSRKEEPLEALIKQFSRLPGIGPKTASRLTFFLLESDNSQINELANALLNVAGKIIRLPAAARAVRVSRPPEAAQVDPQNNDVKLNRSCS